MSPEKFDPSAESAAKILEIEYNGAESAYFSIDSSTKYGDIFVTLGFLEPDPDRVQRYLDRLLSYAVEDMGALNSRKIRVKDPIAAVTEQATIERHIVFGATPKAADLKAALNAVYSEESSRLLSNGILQKLVDQGRLLDGLSVIVSANNEIIATDPGAIIVEMQQLTDQFYGGDGAQPNG